MKNPNPPPRSSGLPADEPNEETFQPTRVWLIVGIMAVVIGLISGFMMSSATFMR
jgi:hypothetical protein